MIKVNSKTDGLTLLNPSQIVYCYFSKTHDSVVIQCIKTWLIVDETLEQIDRLIEEHNDRRRE